MVLMVTDIRIQVSRPHIVYSAGDWGPWVRPKAVVPSQTIASYLEDLS
jgi:hypothetical protein